jgi:valyl-tRNA synthetase
MIELEKSYDASKTEDAIYQKWLDSGFFNPDNWPDKDAEPFSLMLPPPNVTGTLHIGHAFEDTVQDVIIRYQRMLGKKTLWLPGTDHAAIATSSKVEKILQKEEGKSRHDIGRQAFLERAQTFAKESQDTILAQLKKMGVSVDWSRLAYTFDDERNLAVRTAFKRMYDAGLIYRGNRVVNWDVKGQTTISDDEIVHEERDAKLYTFKYSKDFPIPIASTRPETKVGDTAVAVHPDDVRYQQYIGKEYDMEFAGVPIHIKVVADETVEKDFGTGALGVTPAHAQIDAEIAERHNLPFVQVINEYGKMIVGGDDLKGKKVAEARESIVEWLKNTGLLISEEAIKQNIGTAERTGGIIEPLPKLQWFIDVNKKFKIQNSKITGISNGQEVTLKELMQTVVNNGQITIMPERFAKIYAHWIDNLRDWCISRQIWFGHRIPVWYKGDDMHVGVTAPEGEGWIQDEDTLDTWFSAGLWTFSTLGWPEETDDLKMFHPTSIIVPGYEILFFWVARMILMSTFLLGDIPFKKVLLHGIVRDGKGQKFSKSLNNGIDPLDMMAKYGTDALRMALVFGAAPGNDVIFDEQKVKGMKHFANKLWNIARYVLANIKQSDWQFEAKTDADKAILSKLGEAITESTKHIDAFRLHEASQTLYQFVWAEFADVYIEASKAQTQDEALKENTQKILLHTLVTSLKLLHPFMPFLTEELWSKLAEANLLQGRDLLMVSKWPKNK